MSRKSGKLPKLDLKLNLSPPRRNPQSPTRSWPTASPTSPPSSCISSEINQMEDYNNCFSDSPEAASMIIAGCQRCLMYVMLPEKEPRCPKCKSTVLLEVFGEVSGGKGHGHGSNTKTKNKSVL